MHVLIATDAPWIADELMAALGGPETSFTICSEGRLVTELVEQRLPDIAILDLQCGTMGAMAVTMALRLDESAGALEHVRVLMLLDRRADVHLARRSGAEGWLIKPLDPLRIQRAVNAIVGGGTHIEGTTVEDVLATGVVTEDVMATGVVAEDVMAEAVLASGSDHPSGPGSSEGDPASAG